MNSNLLFDFNVNKENNTIHIKREFNANLELVWQAWTNSNLLFTHLVGHCHWTSYY